MLTCSLVAAALTAVQLPDGWRVQRVDGTVLVEQHAAANRRPHIHPLMAPDGKGVYTENEPKHHPWQHGLYTGLHDVNGINFWEKEEGKFHPEPVGRPAVDGDTVRWTVRTRWTGEKGEDVLMETQEWALKDLGANYVLDVVWTLDADKTDVSFGKWSYGGLFIRMPFRPENAGRQYAVNSRGQRNRDAEQQEAEWVEISMPIEGRESNGVVRIEDLPGNPGYPNRWRVDGQLGVSPSYCIRGPWKLGKGEKCVNRYRVTVKGGCKAEDGVFRAVSPDGKNELRLETSSGEMKYSVWRNGRAVVEPTWISLVTKEHGRMDGKGAHPKASSRRIEGSLTTPIYKKASVDFAANETCVDFGEWALRLHARNDGVAWRFETKYRDTVHVTAENTNVRFPGSAELCYGQVRGFETSFETPAKIGPVASVKPGHPQIVITPFTAVVPGAGVVAVTESDLFDYPGLNFYRKDGENDMLHSWQAGVPSEVERKGRWIRVKKRHPYLAKTSGTRAYPWRVFVLGDSPSDLVSADAVYALARPTRLKDASWVKPGLVQWDWWHGFKITDVPGLNTGCNYETYKAYIDFAAANGVGYIIMDEGWSEKLNLDKPRAEANVEGVIKYGKEKGVGVILWAAWSMLSTHEDRKRIFDRYSAMGAKGFKIDFMDRDDQLLERFLYETAADAAERKLVVMYHGIHKPTGLCRTFPNVLNYEGVYGLEQGHSVGGRKVVVSNDVNIVYTRMVAGAMDYTPGAMRNRAFDAPAFQKGRDSRACYGTRCHQLALFPLFEAPVQMLCDSPTQYRTAPECAAFLTKVPTVWDDTVGVAGAIGAYAAVARRKGRNWWLGAITNWEAREVVLPTGFLGGGEWTVEAFEDAPDADVNAEHYVRRTFKIKSGEPLKVRLSRGGGFAARITES